MSPKPVIVVNKNTPQAVEVFSTVGEVIALESSELTPDVVRDADILIVRSETTVDGELLKGSRVGFVGTVTIGTDHVDLEYLKRRNIALASAPGSNANSVKEYVAAALLAWAKRTSTDLAGKTIGIVGVGNVGSRVADLAAMLGMIPLLNDPPRARASRDSAFLPLDTLMECDIVTLHVPLTRSGEDKTWHLFGKDRIGAMKSGSVLINTSRGAVVDSEALLAALGSGHLSAAILDVWENEPDIDANLLEECLIGTPHIAGYSLDGKLNAVRMVYEQLCRFLKTTPRWPEKTIAPHEVVHITVPAGISGEQAIIAHAVRQAYDIERDDSLLRGIFRLDPAARGQYFSRLRADYRTRREFHHVHVDAMSGQATAGESLRKLGFRVRVGSKAS